MTRFVYNQPTLFDRYLEHIGQSILNYEFLGNKQNECASNWRCTRLQARTLVDVLLIQTQTTYEGADSVQIAAIIWTCRIITSSRAVMRIKQFSSVASPRDRLRSKPCIEMIRNQQCMRLKHSNDMNITILFVRTSTYAGQRAWQQWLTSVWNDDSKKLWLVISCRDHRNNDY